MIVKEIPNKHRNLINEFEENIVKVSNFPKLHKLDICNYNYILQLQITKVFCKILADLF